MAKQAALFAHREAIYNQYVSAIYGWMFLGLVALVFLGLPIWALRKHNRMFPKGWDRTGWRPEPGRARRFETMFTYFSGGRGGG